MLSAILAFFFIKETFCKSAVDFHVLNPRKRSNS